MDWLDLLAVQGTLESLLQHHSSKATIPQIFELIQNLIDLDCVNSSKALVCKKEITMQGKVAKQKICI